MRLLLMISTALCRVGGAGLASLAALCVVDAARAQSIGALMAATHQMAVAAPTAPAPATAASSSPSAIAMASASARALQNQTQVNSALSLALQAQAAAQAAARALNQNQLVNAADGLTLGCNPATSACGLTPAVSQPTPASADSTGLATWQGASMPTVGANPNQVSIAQTNPQAVLSWTTFNVGQNSSLTYQQQPGWVALNRVVGQIDPRTGLRNPNLAPAPSQILGSINANGTVLVINQNGVIFGPTSQVNVGSLIASSLEIGTPPSFNANNPNSLGIRNSQFLEFGLLGYQEQQSGQGPAIYTFSAQQAGVGAFHAAIYDAPEGNVQVDAGASLTSADGGYLMLFAPRVTNAGQLSSADGEVALQSGRLITLTPSEGNASSVDPNVRGLVVTSSTAGNLADSIETAGASIIQSPRGYVSLGATPLGSATEGGVIAATTSISENGYVNIFGGTVDIAPHAVISIGPDVSAATIPQDPTSLAEFKPSRVRIGGYAPGSTDASGAVTPPTTTPAMIDIGSGSLIYAPGANISIGADSNVDATASTSATPTSQVVVESGATIDAAGLTDVVISASRNSLKISPVKGNELADAPAFRNGFLNGATVFLDPRLSGVTADGVAWVGSPLISAGAYAQQAGVSVQELMVAGGAVTLGVQAAPAGSMLAAAPQVIVKPGAAIDVSGGWKTYQAGLVQQSYLVAASGAVIPISQADPEATYVGLYTGYTVTQPRWGVSATYLDPVLTGGRLEGQYTEGRDAGSLTVKGSVIALDGQVNAQAFAGPAQLLAATPGTAKSGIAGDLRPLQAAPAQLPAGGYLDVQALSLSNLTGGGDIDIVGSTSYSLGPSATVSLNADAISQMGLSQLTVQTSGKITVAADAAVNLAPGGAFEALAGRTITIAGTVTTPSGSIDLTTADIPSGSVLAPEPLTAFDPSQAGPFDILVDGALNVAGRWANDFDATPGTLVGAAYLNGGEITLDAAPRVTSSPVIGFPGPKSASDATTDISGSIVVAPGATLNLAGGGYVSPVGALTLTSKGGDLSLYADTTYFRLAAPGENVPGGISGFRVSGVASSGSPALPINPPAITSRVSLADGSIIDAGFAGGGVFTLTTPYFSFGDSSLMPVGSAGASLPLEFFSQSGFADFKITSYGTALVPNAFQNTFRGYNAVFQTEVVSVSSGRTLSLTQSYLSPILTDGQVAALEGLPTGSNLLSRVAPAIPSDAWDQKPVSLTLGGALELHVDAGAAVVGPAGGSLAVSQLNNEGLIRIPSGTLTQSEILPSFYVTSGAIAVHSLSDIFGPPGADGTVSETSPNALGLTVNGRPLTNAQVAADNNGQNPIYLLGDLSASEGVRLGPGSVIDLSGEAIVNPRAAPAAGLSSVTEGMVAPGGSIVSTNVFNAGGALFRAAPGSSVYGQFTLSAAGVPDVFNARPGAVINLAGAQATFDEPAVAAGLAGAPQPTLAPTLVWSNGGNLTLNQGSVITGAIIDARGGAPLALGGTLSMLDPVLYQSDPASPTLDAVSADAVGRAGFATFVAQGSLGSVGDVSLSLPRSLFVETPTTFAPPASAQAAADLESPVISSGGALEIDAPYISLAGAFQSVSSPAYGALGSNSVALKADAIDVSGAVVFDQSVARATLSATGDVRLIGAPPSTIGLQTPPPPTLIGQLVANGDLTINATQVYPTTGSTFAITSTGAASPSGSSGGTIRFNSAGAAPASPYSAGGDLLVQAANIVQAGVVRAPLGALTLGANAATAFAPATTSLILAPGSTTSVSADGLNIPYGTTTDQVEWYFSPTSSNPLTAPPAGVLHLAGESISASSGAVVDLQGGGDVYAYEFISGPGGTRDVLNQLNPDRFSSTNGFQYPDGRQIYAIVPGLSNAPVAAYDPIYASNYAALYGPSQAGLRVFLNGGPGLPAGWYTLLPAQYALLPGGMRVVQDTGAATPPPASGATLSDGTIVASGYFGVAGVNTRSPTLQVFDIQPQSVFRQESNIALTLGNAAFAAKAALADTPPPQLPIDADRLILSPVTQLALNATFETTPASLTATGSTPALAGHGSEVDITGASLVVEGANPVNAPAGTIVLTDASLADLNAASLLLGGVRTDNSDGTTSLQVSANSIAIAGGATLSAPEIMLAVDGANSSLTVASGASIFATGAVNGEPTGDYVIDGLASDGVTRIQAAQGGFLRVSNGPQRAISRLHVDPQVAPGVIVIGAANLQGASVEAASLGQLSLSDDAQAQAASLALGAGSISFGGSGAGLVLTPRLQALVGGVADLLLQSPSAIAFVSGSYGFNALSLDAPGLAVLGGGAVALHTGALSLANSGAPSATCGTSGALACGTGSLTLSASSIAFGSGTVRTYGAGSTVTLAAPAGVFVDGAADFDVGPSALTIDSPFVGDRGGGKPGAAIPSLTLTSSGPVLFTSSAPASAFTAPQGTPGAQLAIDGASVSIVGTELRATAGALNVQSASGIAVSGGALLATPGYAQVFGDAADPTTVSAPGGTLSLTALGGDISISDDSILSVGGAQGQAGSLSLTAQNGQVYAYHRQSPDVVALASVLSAGPNGGGSLTLDTGGAFDLSAFAAGSGQQFTGAINIRSAQHDLTLAAGDLLTATSVQLTADGGQILDAGEINTSGAKGGAVGLYGAAGVHLTSTALIDAHADGYGPTSTLQSSGGDVTLGVDGTGAIAVDAGATINVGAVQTANRLVSMSRTNGAYFTFVPGDVGGTVTFRAPVIAQSGGDTVLVSVQGAVAGADSVVLEGFQRFDLSSLASNPNYTGVSIANGTATLNLAATGAGQINALADPNGPVVQFVQDFNVSADYGALNGLAAQANFHARPGIELDYSGNIVLASNWNLGAGVVDVAGAAAAGLMTADSALPGRFFVTPGDEGQLLAQYAAATYHVGGSFYGEPGVLTLRAGGDLDIQGSITDGFFQFGDQTDPGYLNLVLGGGDRAYQGALAPACSGAGGCASVSAYVSGANPRHFVAVTFPVPRGLDRAVFDLPPAPYSAAANTPAALGDTPVAGGALVSGTGDPLGSAQLFPLLPADSGGTTPVNSWSYQLVAGADLAGASGRPSVNPLNVVAASAANLIVSGREVYGYKAVRGMVSFADSLDLADIDKILPVGDPALADINQHPLLSPDAWYDEFLQENAGLGSNSATIIRVSRGNPGAQAAIDQLATKFFAANPSDPMSLLANGGISTTLSVATEFMKFVSDNFSTVAPFFRAPAESGIFPRTTYATTSTLIRTGTGAINLAASGTVDLRNGASPELLDSRGVLVSNEGRRVPAGEQGLQLGGAAVYTAGHLAELGLTTAVDVATGEVLTVNLDANAVVNTNLANLKPLYQYGTGGVGVAGILVADPVYADGGGDVSVNAGLDVLSRRDTFQESELGGVGKSGSINTGASWIGSGDQPWRTGHIGDLVNLQIDPELFSEGIGTLGGGDVSITAGRNVSDLSIVATDSATTADVGGLAAASQPQALVNLGGGDISVTVGANILGGRLDVAAGNATLRAMGTLASAGEITQLVAGNPNQVDNTLRVLLSDGEVSINAGGAVDLQGIGALGLEASGRDSAGFYSAGAGVSILADGPITVANTGNDVLTSAVGNNPTTSAVYPGSFEAVSFTSDLRLSAPQAPNPAGILLYPGPAGTLTLLAGGDIASTVIAQLDSDPTLLPGAFTDYVELPGPVVLSGLSFGFPTVLPNTSDVILRELHNPALSHAGDSAPNRVAAGRDILDMTLSTAKQTRVAAGRDIINMVFLGQNDSPNDITRVAAGRDITATTTLAAPVVGLLGGVAPVLGPQLPAVQGDTFILGGPGALFVEAGRNAGPFLNSAVTDGFQNSNNVDTTTGALTYGGGIITVGNLWNPWLPAQGADIFTEFGVGKGQDYGALISTYLSPKNFANLPAYLFVQTTDSFGDSIPDRTKEIYALSLVDWMKSIATDVISRYDTATGVTAPPASAPALIQFMQGLQKGGSASFAQALSFLPQLSDQRLPLIPWMQLNQGAALVAAYGTLDVTYSQALAAFQSLPALSQRDFLVKDVYFNELTQTSVPSSPSYLKYSRGYEAVNTLFPASLGYTANSLSGGPAGASTTVQTGNLDLRLATIQTEEGGDIVILGPGGRVLAGSTVSTSVQASRRVYDGGALYSGGSVFSPLTAQITQVPPGYEGVLTLRGGSIDSFTDGDFLLNQSRAFTEEGGDIAIWSSNADVNAGLGPRTTADVPPVVVRIDENGLSQASTTSAVSGAGIGAFQPDASGLAPDVFLIAPRGTVDAGAAGVRSAGNVYVAAFQVANADAIQAQGTITGTGAAAPVDVAAQSSGDVASAAASQAAQAASSSGNDANQRPIIFVDVLGYLADESKSCSVDEQRHGVCH
ncbi:MAG: filamentous hemagglutinin family protein [Caulobacteraceae bacterium]|nr:filamentous hemagglutinin family protein [Caulobacteraceae bacterium]